ncbi:MAG: STAS domain-containing protein [Gammaproteobacteria bacterium]|nr:STAS domain-containing protein [Gammaproteobacteria bacterium]
MKNRNEPSAGGDAARIEPAAGGQGRFRIEGELNFASVPPLHERAVSLFAGCPQIALDLSGVTRANSAGLALLLEWQGRARRAGQPFSLRNLPAGLINLARISELEEVLPLDGPAPAGSAH